MLPLVLFSGTTSFLIEKMAGIFRAIPSAILPAHKVNWLKNNLCVGFFFPCVSLFLPFHSHLVNQVSCGGVHSADC